MLRDDIKSFSEKNAPPTLCVPTPDLPDWDGKIFVRRHSSKVSQTLWDQTEPDDNERARYVALVACDAGGVPIFTEFDATWLGCSPVLGATVEAIYWAGRAWNGLTAENRESYRKNLPRGAAGGLPLSSPPSPAVSTSTDLPTN